MTTNAVRHRHYKTLIALVLVMCLGTLLLFWLGELTPATPLRGRSSQANRAWRGIAIRSDHARSDWGFFHFRIDQSGRLFQSSAWKRGAEYPTTPGSISVLLTCDQNAQGVTADQQETLTWTLNELRRVFEISDANIRVEPVRSVAIGDSFE